MSRADLPEFGQILAALRIGAHAGGVPTRQSPDDDALVRHLMDTTGLAEAEVRRVIGDVLAFHAEPVEAYVRRRHLHLQTYGAKNAEIFPTLAAELTTRVVAAPRLTTRQLRRIIYG